MALAALTSACTQPLCCNELRLNTFGVEELIPPWLLLAQHALQPQRLLCL